MDVDGCRGAEVLADAPHGSPEVLLFANGSEAQHCAAAREHVGAEGAAARLVSKPRWEVFGSQLVEYRNAVLPRAGTARLAMEEAAALGWEGHTGTRGAILPMQTSELSTPTAVAQHAHDGIAPNGLQGGVPPQADRFIERPRAWHSPVFIGRAP